MRAVTVKKLRKIWNNMNPQTRPTFQQIKAAWESGGLKKELTK